MGLFKSGWSEFAVVVCKDNAIGFRIVRRNYRINYKKVHKEMA
jgi:hypothetical protein